MITLPFAIPGWAAGLWKHRQAILVVILIIVAAIAWRDFKDSLRQEGRTDAQTEQKEKDDEAEERRKAVPAATSDSVSRSLRAGTF